MTLILTEPRSHRACSQQRELDPMAGTIANQEAEQAATLLGDSGLVHCRKGSKGLNPQRSVATSPNELPRAADEAIHEQCGSAEVAVQPAKVFAWNDAIAVSVGDQHVVELR